METLSLSVKRRIYNMTSNIAQLVQLAIKICQKL